MPRSTRAEVLTRRWRGVTATAAPRPSRPLRALARLDDLAGGRGHRTPAQDAVVALALVVACFDAGLLTALIADRTAPPVVVALPLVVAALAIATARPAWTPCLLVAALPLGLAPVPGGLQLAQLTAVVVVALVAFRRLASGLLPLGWHPALWWAVGGVGAAVAATADSADLPRSTAFVLAVLVGLLLACAVLGTVADLSRARPTVLTLLAAGSVICALSLRDAGKISSALGGSVVDNRLTGVFAQPNELGAFAAMVVLIASAVLLSATRRERPVVLAGLVLGLGALALSLSRGAWIGTAAGGLVLLWLLPPARRALVVAGVPLLLVGGGLAVAVPENPQVQIVSARLASLSDPADNPYDDRPAIWAEALRQVRTEPLTGVGPAAFTAAASRSVSGTRQVRPDHGHSAVLTTAAETGLPGLLCLVGLTVAAAVGVRRALRRLPDVRDRAVLAGLAAALASVVGQGLIDFPLRNAILLQTLWLLLALALVGARQGRLEARLAARRSATPAAASYAALPGRADARPGPTRGGP